MNKDSYLYVFGGIVILVLLGIFAVLLVQTLQPAAAVEPTPTLYEFPTLEAVVGGITATASPSNTAEPTATDTQEPSRTPVPTATVDASATQEAQIIEVYLGFFDEINQKLHDTKTDFDNRFGDLIEGEVSETDEQWKKDITDLLLIFNAYLIPMMALEPPAEYEQAHNLVNEGANLCADGWTNLYSATQTYNNDLYALGVEQVNECNQKWSQGENMIANLRR